VTSPEELVIAPVPVDPRSSSEDVDVANERDDDGERSEVHLGTAWGAVLSTTSTEESRE
jgi:hypothetical protein